MNKSEIVEEFDMFEELWSSTMKAHGKVTPTIPKILLKQQIRSLIKNTGMWNLGLLIEFPENHSAEDSS